MTNTHSGISPNANFTQNSQYPSDFSLETRVDVKLPTLFSLAHSLGEDLFIVKTKMGANVPVLAAPKGITAGTQIFPVFKSLLEQIENPNVAFSFGGTQVQFFSELVKAYRDGWHKIDKCFCVNIDEFAEIGGDDKNSAQAFMRTHLFDHVKVNPRQIDFPHVGNSENFEEILRAKGGLDLTILGLGLNGHVGFNEPGSALDSRTRRISLADTSRKSLIKGFGSIEAVPTEAYTMGIADFRDSRSLILVANHDKKEPLLNALKEGVTIENPSSSLLEHNNILVVVDRELGIALKEEFI